MSGLLAGLVLQLHVGHAQLLQTFLQGGLSVAETVAETLDDRSHGVWQVEADP